MVKSELLTKLKNKFPELQATTVELGLNSILKQIEGALIQGERIEIRGFGSFTLRYRPPRVSRNPKTGEALNLSARVGVHFKPGKEMKDKVNAMRTECSIME